VGENDTQCFRDCRKYPRGIRRLENNFWVCSCMQVHRLLIKLFVGDIGVRLDAREGVCLCTAYLRGGSAPGLYL